MAESPVYDFVTVTNDRLRGMQTTPEQDEVGWFSWIVPVVRQMGNPESKEPIYSFVFARHGAALPTKVYLKHVVSIREVGTVVDDEEDDDDS
jgi:hypothetical protein